MIEAILLSDFLKNLPEKTSLSGLSLLMIDSEGNPVQVSPDFIAPYIMATRGTQITDLNEATEPGVYQLLGSGTVLNGPEGLDVSVGMLEVFYRGGSTGTLYQRITTRTGILTTRARYYGSWSVWRIHS